MNELRDAIIFFNLMGRGVKLEGLGTYLPLIKHSGELNVSHRLDREIKNALNTPGLYNREILNQENIGKSVDELVELWNAEHPDDPVPAG
jgi:hypothetical protein